jgi:hypothetical protein
VEQAEGYFPSVSTCFFPSSFIFLVVASWLVDAVGCVAVAGGALFGREL